jgi:hypothetical protein
MAQRDVQKAANPGSGGGMDKPYDDSSMDKPYERQMIDGVLPLPWLAAEKILAALDCHGTVQIIRAQVQKQSPE